MAKYGNRARPKTPKQQQKDLDYKKAVATRDVTNSLLSTGMSRGSGYRLNLG
jgi:hypothetical protein